MSNNVTFLVQSRITQRNINNLKENLISRGNEVTTGKKQNLTKELKGEIRNFIDLKSLRSSLLNRQERLITGDNRLAQMEVSVSEMKNLIQPFQTLQTQVSLINQSNIDVYVDQAKSTLDGIQNTLNIQWGGRYLFSGEAVQTRPVENINNLITSVETIIADYAAALPDGNISNQTQLDGLFTEIDSVFNDTHATTRFSSLVYYGSENEMAGIEISEGEIMRYDLKANSAQFKQTIQGVVMIATNTKLREVLNNENNPNGSQVNKLEKSYLSKATEYTSGGISDLIQTQASLGFKQERIKFRQEGLDKIIFEYEKRIGNYENADQYESGVAYTEIQTQLEASFYVTSNIADMSLLNFIR
jgi:flagellar hook-associated protein 3 FlgL